MINIWVVAKHGQSRLDRHILTSSECRNAFSGNHLCNGGPLPWETYIKQKYVRRLHARI